MKFIDIVDILLLIFFLLFVGIASYDAFCTREEDDK